MTSGPMRKLTAPSHSLNLLRWKKIVYSTNQLLRNRAPLGQLLPSRSLAQVRPEGLSGLWFTSSSPTHSPADDLLRAPPSGQGKDHKPPDERTLKLGRTLRTLSPLLPNLLTTQLPPEILSPSISLHLFPSTHPHLPAVKGRVPYRAALWTAPVAWGCVPLLGNVKLQILSEKIVRTGFVAVPHDEDKPDLGEEKLVVRWRTEKKKLPNNKDSTGKNTDAGSPNSRSTANSGLNGGLSALLGGEKPIFGLNQDDDFTGIFIFSFDSKGRIATHTIEHADENNGFDKTSKVVTLTDWLLGKARWGGARSKEEELIPGLAIRVCREEWRSNRSTTMQR